MSQPVTSSSSSSASGSQQQQQAPSSASSGDGAGTSNGAPASSLEELVTKLAKQVEELGGSVKGLKSDFIRHRVSKKKGGASASAGVAKTDEDGEPDGDADEPRAAGAGRSFAAQVRLSAEIATLPEAVRNELVAGLEAEEISLEQALERASWLKKGMGLSATQGPSTANGGKPKPTPPGVAGSAPTEPPAPSFATREDWEKFKKENRGEAMRLLANPNFDPTTLQRKGSRR